MASDYCPLFEFAFLLWYSPLNKNSLGPEKVYLDYTSRLQSITEGKSWQEHRAGTWSRSHGDVASSLPCSLVPRESRLTLIGLVLLPVGWALPHQPAIKTIPHRRGQASLICSVPCWDAFRWHEASSKWQLTLCYSPSVKHIFSPTSCGRGQLSWHS